MAVIKIEPKAQAVIGKQDAVEYCGSSEDLFRLLCTDYGLVPLYEKGTRKLYRVESIDKALLELEMVKFNQEKLNGRRKV